MGASITLEPLQRLSWIVPLAVPQSSARALVVVCRTRRIAAPATFQISEFATAPYSGPGQSVVDIQTIRIACRGADRIRSARVRRAQSAF
jgi:hypothetical protein